VDRFIPRAEITHQGVFPLFLRLMGWGCSHDNYTVPMRLPGETELTVSCLQCGARLRYDWERMALADGRSKLARLQATRACTNVINKVRARPWPVR
jgi:hypothetical protein